jgi:hypothetical protein
VTTPGMRYAAPAIRQKHKHIRGRRTIWLRVGPANDEGNFTPGSNVLKTANPYLHFEMNVNRDAVHGGALPGDDGADFR